MGIVKTLFPVSVGSAVIDGIYEITPSDGNTVLRPISDGNVSAFLAMVTSRVPTLQFGTYALATALAVTGYGVEDDEDVVCYDVPRGPDGVRLSTGCTRYTFTDALTVPRVLSLQQDSPATLTMEAFGVGAAPLTVD